MRDSELCRFADEIDGDGFRLRRWRPGDVASLVRHANDEAVSRCLRDRFPYPYGEADARAWLDHAAGNEPAWAIEIDGSAAGGIGLRPGEDVHRHSAEIGYWLGQAFWNRGLMTRAVRRLTAIALGEAGLHRVFAHAYANNPASARVLEKNGYRCEGVLRDAVLKRGELVDAIVYARLRGDVVEAAR